MEMRDAERLRAQYGNKPCACEHVERERDRGIGTQAFLCRICGRIFDSRKDWRAFRETQAPPADCET